jgi:acyl dehydratase
MTLITDQVRALMGAESEKQTSPIPVSEELLRRFTQAVMEDNPVHWDHATAQASKYGEVVATPLFPLHASRRPPGAADPFERFKDDAQDDGTLGESGGWGLPPIDIPLKRVLNGGTEAEFFKLACIGDIISSRSRYVDIAERQGRDGNPLVIVRVATTYTNQHDEVLAVITTSMIRR